MYWYWLGWKRGLDFTGYSSRREFWVFMLAHLIVTVLFIAVDVGLSFPWIDILYNLLSIIPLCALIVRRCHDIGKSGLWSLIFFIPVIGPFGCMYLLAQPSLLVNRQREELC
ncbi:DUF805 domain-containing protein [Vibrio hepatarius]|uniref:DUF805 domain-containing protein n=1 Tax=Vibrio hepatarius TaxID=171383 RepID=UPI001C0A6326|nr:DUF805 domain-containing protein [Vibrio hepatarius]MBU2897066.1 DUF805 domain-containing protein [Vibrio hepatarius]